MPRVNPTVQEPQRHTAPTTLKVKLRLAVPPKVSAKPGLNLSGVAATGHYRRRPYAVSIATNQRAGANILNVHWRAI